MGNELVVCGRSTHMRALALSLLVCGRVAAFSTMPIALQRQMSVPAFLSWVPSFLQDTGSVVDRAVLVNSLKTREGALEVFSQIDANRDGVLSLEEVEHAGAEAKEPRFACAGACVTITTAVLASSVGSAVGAVVGAVAHALVTKMLDDD